MSLRDPEYYVAVTTIRDGVEDVKWKTAYMKPGGVQKGTRDALKLQQA